MRVVFGILLLSIALPAIFAFEGISAVTAVFLNRQTWYDVMAEPTLYETFMDTVLPENFAQREAALAAVPPAYVQTQLNKLVDYGLELLDNDSPEAPVFDIPAPLVPAIREHPLFAAFNAQEQPNGSLKLTLNLSERSIGGIRQLGFQLAMVTVVSAVLGFLLWVVAAWVAGEGARGRLLWLGIPLMLASFVVVIAGASAINAVIPSITSELSRNTAGMSEIELAVSRGLLTVVPRFTTALTVAGGIPFVIGLILMVIGLRLAPKRTESISLYR